MNRLLMSLLTLSACLLAQMDARAQVGASKQPPKATVPDGGGRLNAVGGVFIENMTWDEVYAAVQGGKRTAIVAFGSTEQNGPNLALGKHNFVVKEVGAQLAALLGNALVYPVVPLAPTGDPLFRSGHMRFSGSVSVSEATYQSMAYDLALSACAAGFSLVAILGDHGGGQAALSRAADLAQADWGRRSPAQPCRVMHVGDSYELAERKINAQIAQSLGAGGEGHGAVADKSELMAVDRNGQWVRKDKKLPEMPENGVTGSSVGASADLGKTFIQIKSNAAFEKIRQEQQKMGLVAPR